MSVLGLALSAGAMAATPSGFSPVPSPVIPQGSLNGVDATGPNDAWAVGREFTDVGARMVVEHWNGAAWSRVTLPSPIAGLQAGLTDVLALSPTDVWAVGNYGALGQSRALIIHKSAAGWSRYTLNQIPYGNPEEPDNAFLNGVGGSSDDNLWAVGQLGDRPLALHFTGTSWTYLDPPSPPISRGNGNPLNAVRVIGPSNVYMVGNSVQDGGTFFQSNPWSLRWDGTGFGNIKYFTHPFPNPPNSASGVNDLDAVGSRPIAVGVGVTSDNIQQGAIWRLASGSWNPVTPFSDATSHWLNSVQVVGSRNIWSVGHRLTTSGELRTWIVHWNGTSWESLGGPNPRAGDSTLKGVSSVPGSSVLWAVGDSGGVPLILKRP